MLTPWSVDQPTIDELNLIKLAGDVLFHSGEATLPRNAFPAIYPRGVLMVTGLQ